MAGKNWRAPALPRLRIVPDLIGRCQVLSAERNDSGLLGNKSSISRSSSINDLRIKDTRYGEREHDINQSDGSSELAGSDSKLRWYRPAYFSHFHGMGWPFVNVSAMAPAVAGRKFSKDVPEAVTRDPAVSPTKG